MSKCKGVVCLPHKDGRMRACNPATGRCILVNAVNKSINIAGHAQPNSGVVPSQWRMVIDGKVYDARKLGQVLGKANRETKGKPVIKAGGRTLTRNEMIAIGEKTGYGGRRRRSDDKYMARRDGIEFKKQNKVKSDLGKKAAKAFADFATSHDVAVDFDQSQYERLIWAIKHMSTSDVMQLIKQVENKREKDLVGMEGYGGKRTAKMIDHIARVRAQGRRRLTDTMVGNSHP